MTTIRGHRKLLEQLRADGIRHIFGNPGSSEEGLLDEISRFPDIQYVLGLQEAAIMAVADGYAQSTRRPAIVQLHSGVGLGNGISGLYHALRKRTPLVVLAGEAGVAYDALEAHMAVDLVALARPVTKYAARVVHPGSVLRLLRRCIKVALTPPLGPVFLALPQDVLDAPNDEQVVPTLVPDTRVVPEPAALERCARWLEGASRPVLLVGDGVAHSEAQAELARLAELLGARVYGLMASEVCLPWSHPLWCGLTGHMFGDGSAQRVRDADAVLICGTYTYPEVFPLLQNPLAAGVPVIHIDASSYDIAKNHPVSMGLVSDPKLTLGALAQILESSMSAPQRAAAAERRENIGARNMRARQVGRELDRERRDQVPMRLSAFAEELAKVLPKDAMIYDESLTYMPELMRWLPPTEPGALLQTPGGTLGVGLPGAIGMKLAHPERVVVGFAGDGGAMYTLQALWTAAHYGIGAKFVVCNNRGYRLLKQNLVDYWSVVGLPGEVFPASFDIERPCIDFVSLAKGLGVVAERVEHPRELEAAITSMLSHDGPYLLELVLEREVVVPAQPADGLPAPRGQCSGDLPCS
jgi:thiamine pyrophosphate-dependent acetolactate synthase large subunit-like protein